ncbi:MAG TPA: acyltransferase family protein [Ilumatobacteraceae bacterium]|nr:acyltransferase family protein [Ilumatobacteraceae bacterium]
MRETHRLEYQPALDGVRALAVLAVVLFHAGTPGFGGGYLGVSLFFTLSGYLITSLLLREHDAAGSVDFRAFYGRRMRRLLPASVATVAVIVVITAVSDVFDGVVGLRAQVVGALFQVSNWVLLAGDTSYQDLLAQGSGAVSPLEHFWSLAIEEQFYWLWPPLVALLLVRVSVQRRRTWIIGAVTLTSMVAAPVIAHIWGPDAAYWATPARLGEILVGAFLAFVLTGAALPKRVSLLAPICLVALGAAVVLFPSSSGPAYEGFLPLVAVVSGGLIVGLQADSPLRRVLSLRPFVAVGMISYGIYLIHWPVFVIVDADRTGLDGPPLTIIRLLITAVIAIASYYLLERPIRMQRGLTFRLTAATAAAASLAVIAVAVVVVPGGPTNYWQVETDALAAASIDADSRPIALTAAPNTSAGAPTTTLRPSATTTVPSDAPVTTPGPTTTTTTPLPELARPVRIVVTGDSTGDALGTGVVMWAASNPPLAQAEVHAALGCGFVMGGERSWGDQIVSTGSCDGWTQTQLFPEVERTQPDVVTVMTPMWDLIDQRWEGGELLSPSDPEYRARLVTAYTQLVDDLIAAGAARVAFVRGPVPNVWWNDVVDGESDPRRHEVLADVWEEVAASHPATVRIIDLATWFSDNDLDADRDARPDGIHLAPEAATSITDQFLGEQLIAAALR